MDKLELLNMLVDEVQHDVDNNPYDEVNIGTIINDMNLDDDEHYFLMQYVNEEELFTFD